MATPISRAGGQTFPGLLMLFCQTILGLRCYRATQTNRSIGLVPTMGALHAGHRSLIDRARQENDLVVVSIFVNPLQFGPQEDFERYPRTPTADLELCRAAGVDVVFAPDRANLGLSADLPITQVVPPAALTDRLCGKARPGHFTGVATIVQQLFQIVQPTRAYFGQKDAQQLAIIRRMVQDLHLPLRIVGCPIVRDHQGLALSSRNQYLSGAAATAAPNLYRSLTAARDAFNQGERQGPALVAAARHHLATNPALEVEYLELVDPHSLAPLDTVVGTGLLAIAARVGQTRLIDNITLGQRRPIIAIDGPAGAGKSTVTRQVAQTLGLQFLDTGAMYRAVTWLVLQRGDEIPDEPAIADLVAAAKIELRGSQVLVNGQDVSQAIRSLEVTSKVSAIAALGAVRTALVQQQQEIGQLGGLVAEGRDMGSEVFPEAEVKIFLTASVRERAQRRLAELHSQGVTTMDQAALEVAIAERDHLDSTREIAPLRRAAAAVELVTDGLSIEQVVGQIVTHYHQATGAAT